MFFSSDGQPDYGENAVNEKVGPSIQISAVVSQPGYDPYVVSLSYSGYSVSRPSCAEINADEPPGCAIRTPAKKIGQARVGRTVRVRPPRTTGECGRVTYTWKAGGKVVKRARALHVTPRLRGRKLVAIVKPTQADPTVLRFGRVR